MQKLRLLRLVKLFSIPPIASLPALVILVLLVTARRPSLLATYEVFSLTMSSPAAAIARVPRGCDMFRGEWVPDDGMPYYTNDTCVVIQEHQNCLKYGRPDRGFLKWRWRPADCELPRFDAEGLLETVRDKSLAFVGDSLARNHMQSLMCLLSKVEYPIDMSKHTDQDFRTLHYGSHNFTISIFWSPFLVRSQEADPAAHLWLWNLHLDEPDAAWVAGVAGFDYVVISAANWFTRPSMFYEAGRLVGCHFCLRPNVTDLTLRYSLRAAFRTALRALVSHEEFKGKVIVRTLSPTSHFEGGEWDKGGDCRQTLPRRGNETRMAGLDLDMYTAQVEEFNGVAEASGKAARLMLMDTTEAMLRRPDGHPSRYGHWAHENVTLYNDCVHWCLPGPIDLWNEMLFQMLLV